MTQSFADRVAVVTGGASGIGRSCAQRLAAAGAKVVVIDINEAAAARVAAEIGGTSHKVDVASPTEIAEAAADIERNVGAVSLLVNAAAILQLTMPPPQELALDDFARMVEVNLKGTYCACATFGAGMAERGKGAIVNIASISGMRSTPLHGYGPLKAAIISMTENLAAAWGRSGVRVNSVSPGAVLTPALQVAVDRGLRNVVALRNSTATGRIVTMEDVAAVVAFLLGDEAVAITGVNVPVDAGWLVANSWAMFGGLPPLKDDQGQ